MKLAKEGAAKTAGSYKITKTLSGWLSKHTEDAVTSQLRELGESIASEIYEEHQDVEKVAATLLLTAFDGAYNLVSAVGWPYTIV